MLTNTSSPLRWAAIGTEERLSEARLALEAAQAELRDAERAASDLTQLSATVLNNDTQLNALKTTAAGHRAVAGVRAFCASDWVRDKSLDGLQMLRHLQQSTLATAATVGQGTACQMFGAVALEALRRVQADGGDAGTLGRSLLLSDAVPVETARDAQWLHLGRAWTSEWTASSKAAFSTQCQAVAPAIFEGMASDQSPSRDTLLAVAEQTGQASQVSRDGLRYFGSHALARDLSPGQRALLPYGIEPERTVEQKVDLTLQALALSQPPLPNGHYS